MWQTFLLTLAVVATIWQNAEAIMCHRCFSAMGGCGDHVHWQMFPWRDCGASEFCVKVIRTVGTEKEIIRECEENLMGSTYHRLHMPVLRRHGYCLPARKNDFWNPTVTTDPGIEYCFCNDWNGCNSAPGLANNKICVFSFITMLAGYILRTLL